MNCFIRNKHLKETVLAIGEGGIDRYFSDYSGPNGGGTWDKYEDCALAGIEYCLDNLI